MVRHCIIAFINQKLRISLYQFLIFSSFFPRSSHSQRTVKSTNSSGSSRIPIKRNSSLRKKKNVMNQYKSGTDEEEPQTLVIEPQIPPASPSKMPIRYAIFCFFDVSYLKHFFYVITAKQNLTICRFPYQDPTMVTLSMTSLRNITIILHVADLQWQKGRFCNEKRRQPNSGIKAVAGVPNQEPLPRQ